MRLRSLDNRSWLVGETLTLHVTTPLCLYRSPTQADSSEDLPQPTGPTTAVRELIGTSMFIFFSMGGSSGSHEKVPSVILRLTSAAPTER